MTWWLGGWYECYALCFGCRFSAYTQRHREWWFVWLLLLSRFQWIWFAVQRWIVCLLMVFLMLGRELIINFLEFWWDSLACCVEASALNSLLWHLLFNISGSYRIFNLTKTRAGPGLTLPWHLLHCETWVWVTILTDRLMDFGWTFFSYFDIINYPKAHKINFKAIIEFQPFGKWRKSG